MPQKKGRSAWLITWEATGGYMKGAKRGRKKYAAILNPNWSPDVVCTILESLYAYEEQVSLIDCLEYAKVSSGVSSPARKKSPYPYLAKKNPYKGDYICGDSLYLRARLVDELQVIEEKNGREKLVWKDRPVVLSPRMKKLLRNED
ncbi:MAG: hypothetical protein HY268_20695 [Deltaproteobacteria bacterium]|nr:hypothetical protein [Deltaproteobacteria bacterium]